MQDVGYISNARVVVVSEWMSLIAAFNEWVPSLLDGACVVVVIGDNVSRGRGGGDMTTV